jgi:hypothetical protein
LPPSHTLVPSLLTKYLLSQHLLSGVHTGQHVTCPYCYNDQVNIASELAKHLERGECPRAPTFHRRSLFKIIRHKDQFHLMTLPAIEENALQATIVSFNGQAYQCFLCLHLTTERQAMIQHYLDPRRKLFTRPPPSSKYLVLKRAPANLSAIRHPHHDIRQGEALLLRERDMP